MIIEAGVLGGLSAVGFGATFTRLPKKAKKFILDHPLVTDIVATGMTYKVLGGTLTALTAAGFMSVGVSAVLFVPGILAARKIRKSKKRAAKEAKATLPKVIYL